MDIFKSIGNKSKFYLVLLSSLFLINNAVANSDDDLLASYSISFCDTCNTDSDFKASGIDQYQAESIKAGQVKDILVVNEYSQEMKTIRVHSEYVDLIGGFRLRYMSHLITTDYRVQELWEQHIIARPLMLEIRAILLEKIAKGETVEVEINRDWDDNIQDITGPISRAIADSIGGTGWSLWDVIVGGGKSGFLPIGTKVVVTTPNGDKLTLVIQEPFLTDRYLLVFIVDKDGNIKRIGPFSAVPGTPGSYFYNLPHGGQVLFCRSCGTGTVTVEGGPADEEEN